MSVVVVVPVALEYVLDAIFVYSDVGTEEVEPAVVPEDISRPVTEFPLSAFADVTTT